MRRNRCISTVPNKEYGVRTIINAIRDEHNEIQFRVQWEGYDDDTWEPLKNLTNCPERVDEFVRTHPDCPALPIISEDPKRKRKKRLPAMTGKILGFLLATEE